MGSNNRGKTATNFFGAVRVFSFVDAVVVAVAVSFNFNCGLLMQLQ